MTLDATIRWKRSQDQISCDLHGEAAILKVSSGLYYTLDSMGAAIWNLLKEPKTSREIVALILKEYEVDAERCNQDVVTLLQKLSSEKLIEAFSENETSR